MKFYGLKIYISGYMDQHLRFNVLAFEKANN